MLFVAKFVWFKGISGMGGFTLNGRWWLIGVTALASVAAGSAALSAPAFDPRSLPQSCQDTLAAMQGDKARFAGLGKSMTQARKASDTESFCKSAREIVGIIKEQGGRLDYCIGDLAGAKDVPENASNQMMQLKSIYRQMFEAAKDPKNDRFKCGLADQ